LLNNSKKRLNSMRWLLKKLRKLRVRLGLQNLDLAPFSITELSLSMYCYILKLLEILNWRIHLGS